MLAGLLTRLQGWILTAGAVLAVLAGAYAMGGRAARKAAELDEQRRQDRARERMQEVDREIDDMDRDALRERAARWVRPGTEGDE